ncbi:MAG TPA: nitrous oxide reductase family maturation protein NosD [Pyrinomonadaceae bacterium]|nr:nitrous oxide reductase family maturation protein NosD [Pyrinomonadaceae bacterium]
MRVQLEKPILCAASVFSVPPWLGALVNHRDTEDTEVAQRTILRSILWTWIVIIALVSVSQATTLTVGATAQFQSIQKAITAAQSGDVIEVHAGIYNENLLIDRQLTLVGIDRPTLHGSEIGSVVVITANSCILRGFRIEHSGADLQTEDSGILLKSSNNRIEQNELTDVLYGIYFYRSSGNVIRSNTIRGRKEVEAGERGAGLHLWDSPNNTIEDNTIAEMRDGMYIQSCNGNQIRRNHISNLRYGLHYMFSDRNIFEDNFFENNVAGAAIMYSNHIEFRRNAFVRNRGFSSFGILFQECNELIAEGNFIIDNATGIFMEALRKTKFRRNVIAQNDVALQMFSNSDDNVFTENNFVDNLTMLQLIGKSTTTKWAENGRGNFWSGYDGYDVNEDGRGDVPQRVQDVFEYIEGNHPRLQIYLDSPAAKALAVAERVFPVFKGSSEIDDAPLMQAVEFHYPFAADARHQGFRLVPTLISLVIFIGACAVMWKNQRRHLRFSVANSRYRNAVASGPSSDDRIGQ